MKRGRLCQLIRTCCFAQRSGSRQADGTLRLLPPAAPAPLEALLAPLWAGDGCCKDTPCAPALVLALPVRSRENWRSGWQQPPEGRRRIAAVAGAAAAAALGRGAKLGCSHEPPRIITLPAF